MGKEGELPSCTVDVGETELVWERGKRTETGDR